LHLETGQETLA